MVQEKHLKELFKYIEANWEVCVSQVDKTDIKRIFGGVLCEDIMNDTLHEVKDEQPALNPIAEAYERGEKIRHKNWLNGDWIQKHKETKTIDNHGNINSVYPFTSIQYPENWELYTEPTDQVTDQEPDHEQPQEKPALNPIAEAYHNYEPIRYKKWEKFQWIKKHSEFEAKTEDGAIFYVVSLNFNTHPQLWELYTEPTEPSSQVILNNSFDRDRFEAMFRAVILSMWATSIKDDIKTTEQALAKLDAYYATKEGGSNG